MYRSSTFLAYLLVAIFSVFLGFAWGYSYAHFNIYGCLFVVLFVALVGGIAIYRFYAYIKLNRLYNLLVNAADAIPHGLFVVSPSNKIAFRNSAFEMFFYPSIVNSGVAKRLASIVKRVRLGQCAQEILQFKDSSGQDVSYRLTASQLQRYPGYIAFSIGDVSDVLSPAPQSFEIQSLLDKAPVGVFSVNSSGEFLYKNQVVDQWLSKKGTKKLNLFKALDVADDRNALFPDQVNANLQKTYEHYFSVNKQFYRVFQRFVKNGKDQYITASVLFKSKRNRPSIAIAGETFKAAFNYAPAGILLVDEKNNIQEANLQVASMLNKNPAELVGRTLESFLNFSCRKGVLGGIARAFNKAPPEKPIEIAFKGLKDSDLAAYMSPLEEDGRIIACIIHLISTSEQKKMEIQFVHSQRMQAVGQLAGGVAHDFNNLLTAMIGFCDLLLQRHSPAEQSFSDIMQIKQNANRAAGLVRQLLAFSRQQSLQPKVINITDALSELSALLRRLLGPAIELKVKHERDLWVIKVDKGQFEQVVINLAVNARDAMEHKGVLKITTLNYVNKKTFVQNHDSMPPGDYVLIELEDTGSGISADIIDRIFEPFFSTKAIGSGTGLGLSTVYGIVKQTGGFIFVESALKKGTAFKIFLPRHIAKEDEEQHVHEDKALKDLTGTARILLVEDEDAVRMFAARALKDKGYEVLEASNAMDAIDIAKNNQDIDLIITDVVMPGMDGPHMINEVRQFMPKVQVVFISGYAEDSFRSKLNTEENIHFLPKPFNLKDLALKVKDILS